MDIITGIAATKQALDIATALKGIEKSYDEAKLKAQLADLVSALADAKMSMVDAKEELAAKDEEIDRLKANFALKVELIEGRGGYLFKTDPNGQPIGYPVCPSCDATDGRIVQLKQDGGIIQARCPVCSKKFSPVTCYLKRSDNGPETREAEEKIKRDAESARMSARLRELGNKLA